MTSDDYVVVRDDYVVVRERPRDLFSLYIRSFLYVLGTCLPQIGIRTRISYEPRTNKSMCSYFISFYFFAHFYFPASGQAVATGSSLLPPGSCLQFLSRMGFSNPTARRFFIECCELTLPRFPQSICAQEKSPRIYTNMHSGGFELTKLTYTRLIRHRGDLLHTCLVCKT